MLRLLLETPLRELRILFLSSGAGARRSAAASHSRSEGPKVEQASRDALSNTPWFKRFCRRLDAEF